MEGERFPAEDPYIWYQDGRYRAIVKRIKHEGKKRLFLLVQYDSNDGFDWKPAKYHTISERIIGMGKWTKTTIYSFRKTSGVYRKW